MVTALDLGARIPAPVLRGENPLPTPRALESGVLARERFRQIDVPESLRQIPVVDDLDPREPRRKRGANAFRKRNAAVFSGFRVADHDSVLRELDFLDPETQALEKPH